MPRAEMEMIPVELVDICYRVSAARAFIHWLLSKRIPCFIIKANWFLSKAYTLHLVGYTAITSIIL